MKCYGVVLVFTFSCRPKIEFKKKLPFSFTNAYEMCVSQWPRLWSVWSLWDRGAFSRECMRSGNVACRMVAQDLVSGLLCKIELVITKDKTFVFLLWYTFSDY